MASGVPGVPIRGADVQRARHKIPAISTFVQRMVHRDPGDGALLETVTLVAGISNRCVATVVALPERCSRTSSVPRHGATFGTGMGGTSA